MSKLIASILNGEMFKIRLCPGPGSRHWKLITGPDDVPDFLRDSVSVWNDRLMPSFYDSFDAGAYPCILSWESDRYPSGYQTRCYRPDDRNHVFAEDGQMMDLYSADEAALLLFGNEPPKWFARCDNIVIEDGQCKVTEFGVTHSVPMPSHECERTGILVNFGGFIDVLSLSNPRLKDYYVNDDDGVRPLLEIL